MENKGGMKVKVLTIDDACLEQIRFILLQNRQGKTRLAKYYIPLEDSEKHKLEYEVVIFDTREYSAVLF